MENIWFTIIAAVILMAFAILCLAIGLLLSRKKLKRGCGLPPDKEGKDPSCSLCGSHKRCHDKEEENDDTH